MYREREREREREKRMICQKGDKRLMYLAVSIMQNEKRFVLTQNAVFFHWPESRVLT